MVKSLNDPLVESTLRSPGVMHPSPEDWRDCWIYFLLVDRFNHPSNPPNNPQLAYLPYQGGNFAGIVERLPYLKRMGVGAIWLSPVQMNPQWFTDYYGGYATLDFLRIEPRFCSDLDAAIADPTVADAEFRALVDAAHAEDIYVILDIVLNHVGDLFNYEGARDSAPWKRELPEYQIYWRDETGRARGDWPQIGNVASVPDLGGIWPQELQRNDYFRRRGSENPSDITQGDFDRLKEIVTEYLEPQTNNFPVRNHLIQAYQYLIAKFDLDGFRIDTLQYVEPHQ
jgi:glycosidase